MSQLVPPYPSLRIFGEKLAPILGSTPDALYERQRSLVTSGLLELAGRGRGGGTKASPRNIALLLIALLASDSPADAGERAKKLAAMKPITRPNPYTGENTFLAVLAHIVEHGFAAPTQFPKTIVVSRQSITARIDWPINAANTVPDFYSLSGKFENEPMRVLRDELAGAALLVIRREIYKLQRGITAQ